MNLENMKLLPGYFSAMDELSLGQVIMILSKEHSNQMAIEMTRKYCLQAGSDEIQKIGMEFLYTHGYYNDLQLLINKNLESMNSSNRTWAKVYELMLYHKKYRKSFEKLREQLFAIRTSEPELKCLIELTIVDTYYSQLQFGKIGNLIDKQFELFDAIEDDFILASLNLRFYQRLFVYHWKRNELIMARKYAFRGINLANNPATKANLHMNLGLTYTFDTYYQGMYHLKEALKIAEEYNFDRVKTATNKFNIPFLSAHFNKTRGISSDDISEQAHIEISRGNKDRAVEMLKDIPLNSPFKLYYMGLAKQDESLLIQSYHYFIERRSDYFFSRLPINALNNFK